LLRFKTYVIIIFTEKYWFFLIKRGGGTGPCETRQPALCTVPIPAGFILKDEEHEWGLFIVKRFFYFRRKLIHDSSKIAFWE
jgi:hypothetical protein